MAEKMITGGGGGFPPTGGKTRLDSATVPGGPSPLGCTEGEGCMQWAGAVGEKRTGKRSGQRKGQG